MYISEENTLFGLKKDIINIIYQIVCSYKNVKTLRKVLTHWRFEE